MSHRDVKDYCIDSMEVFPVEPTVWTLVDNLFFTECGLGWIAFFFSFSVSYSTTANQCQFFCVCIDELKHKRKTG